MALYCVLYHKKKATAIRRLRLLLAEMKRFELLRRGTPDLPHFECGPFNHLGTSPNICAFKAQEVLYHNR